MPNIAVKTGSRVEMIEACPAPRAGIPLKKRRMGTTVERKQESQPCADARIRRCLQRIRVSQSIFGNLDAKKRTKPLLHPEPPGEKACLGLVQMLCQTKNQFRRYEPDVCQIRFGTQTLGQETSTHQPQGCSVLFSARALSKPFTFIRLYGLGATRPK